MPGETEEWLGHLAGHTNEWWLILGLSVFTDILFLPVSWAAYTALKDLGRNTVLAGASLLILFVVLDLAVTWPNYAVLINISGKYAAANDEVLRTALVTAATYAFEVLSSTLFGVYTILIPSLGILAFGVVMRKSIFGKSAGILGIVTGIMGIVSVAGPFFVPILGMAAVLTSVLTLIWLIMIGCKLLRFH